MKTTLKLIFLKKVDKKYIKIIYLTYLCPINLSNMKKQVSESIMKQRTIVRLTQIGYTTEEATKLTEISIASSRLSYKC